MIKSQIACFFHIDLIMLYLEEMQVLPKNDKNKLYSGFKENQGDQQKFIDFVEDSNQEKQIASSIDQQHRTIPCSRSMAVKFFPFLNEFHDKLINLQQNESPDNDSYSSDSQSYFSQTTFQIPKKSSRSSLVQDNPKGRRRSSIKNRSRQSIQIIEAKMLDGKFNGPAKLLLANGSIFSGQTEKGELKHGKIVFQSGLQYEGAFKDGVYQGESKLTLPNGTIIYIEWINGEPKKNGKICYLNTDVYEGDVLNFKKHGEGVLKLKNGNKYVGEFVDGVISGKGAYYDVTGKLIAEGMWYDGKFVGHTDSFIQSLTEQGQGQ